MNTKELAKYYSNLLILQYINKPKATGHIETNAIPLLLPQPSKQAVSLQTSPASGSIFFSYKGTSFPEILWDDTQETIQNKFRSVEGFEQITVKGNLTTQLLIVNLLGVELPADNLTIEESTLRNSDSEIITIEVEQIDKILPLAIEDAFNLTGTNIAVGAQLDVLGKYVGVSRRAAGPEGQIILNDEDYLTLIKMKIIKNNSWATLAEIDEILFLFFGFDLTVEDTYDMNLRYTISPNVASPDLMNMFFTQDILPRPMAVGINIITYQLYPFGFSETNYPLPEHIRGFGELTYREELLELSDGSVLELFDDSLLAVVPDKDAIDYEALRGGYFSELIEG